MVTSGRPGQAGAGAAIGRPDFYATGQRELSTDILQRHSDRCESSFKEVHPSDELNVSLVCLHVCAQVLGTTL